MKTKVIWSIQPDTRGFFIEARNPVSGAELCESFTDYGVDDEQRIEDEKALIIRRLNIARAAEGSGVRYE